MNSLVKRSFRALAALGLVAAGMAGISSCGGGGGGSSSAVTLAITEANAFDVSSSVVQAVGATFDVGSATGGQGTPGATGVAPAGASAARRVLSLLSRDHIQSLGVQPSAAFGPVTEPCDVSGTVTLSGNVADPNTLTVGDRITASFDQCQDNDPFLLNGGLGLIVRAIQGDLLTDTSLVTLDLTLTNLNVTDGSMESFTADGACTLTLDSLDFPVSRSRIAGSSLELRSLQEVFALTRFDHFQEVDATVLPETFVAEALGTLDSQALGGSVRYQTVIRVELVGDNDPDQGEILITGKNGTTVRIVIVNSTSIRLDIDVDGNGSVDASQITSWPALNGQL